jgi:hypothetical protein
MRIKEYFKTFDINPISPSMLHGPVTETLIEHLHQTNEQKRQQSIDQLGDKWLLHPANHLQKEAR